MSSLKDGMKTWPEDEARPAGGATGLELKDQLIPPPLVVATVELPTYAHSPPSPLASLSSERAHEMAKPLRCWRQALLETAMLPVPLVRLTMEYATTDQVGPQVADLLSRNANGSCCWCLFYVDVPRWWNAEQPLFSPALKSAWLSQHTQHGHSCLCIVILGGPQPLDPTSAQARCLNLPPNAFVFEDQDYSFADRDSTELLGGYGCFSAQTRKLSPTWGPPPHADASSPPSHWNPEYLRRYEKEWAPNFVFHRVSSHAPPIVLNRYIGLFNRGGGGMVVGMQGRPLLEPVGLPCGPPGTGGRVPAPMESRGTHEQKDDSNTHKDDHSVEPQPERKPNDSHPCVTM